MSDQIKRLREAGYDTYDRGGTVVVDVPSPRVNDDDYFHGENPSRGIGIRGPEAESIIAGQGAAVQPGQSTADVQQAAGGAGWNEQAGATGEAAPRDDGPDHSWSNDRLREYAAEQNINLHGASTKADILSAIEKGDTNDGEGDES